MNLCYKERKKKLKPCKMKMKKSVEKRKHKNNKFGKKEN